MRPLPDEPSLATPHKAFNGHYPPQSDSKAERILQPQETAPMEIDLDEGSLEVSELHALHSLIPVPSDADVL